MTNSKAPNGFTFTEVIIALAMVGVLLTSLLVLQSSVFRRVVLTTSRVDHFYPVRELMVTTLMHPLKKGETRLQKQSEDQHLSLVYEQKELSATSVLARFKGLYQRKATGTWHDQEGRERVQEVIGYGFIPPSAEKQS